MKVEIHFRDSSPNGQRNKGGRIVMESCRVIREAGDRVRLNNCAYAAARYFEMAAKALIADRGAEFLKRVVNAAKEEKTEDVR